MGWTAAQIEAEIATASSWITHLTDFESARGHAECALAAYEAAELGREDRIRVARSLAWLFGQVHDPATAERLEREAAELER